MFFLHPNANANGGSSQEPAGQDAVGSVSTSESVGKMATGRYDDTRPSRERKRLSG